MVPSSHWSRGQVRQEPPVPPRDLGRIYAEQASLCTQPKRGVGAINLQAETIASLCFNEIHFVVAEDTIGEAVDRHRMVLEFNLDASTVGQQSLRSLRCSHGRDPIDFSEQMPTKVDPMRTELQYDS